MKKVVNKTINHFVKNVDTYNNAGSTWLIFTETKQWVIELTVEKTLWYNYNFFKNVFNYVGLDVVENQHYITEWVEDNIINKRTIVQNGVNYTGSNTRDESHQVEDTIQNGVKNTEHYNLNIHQQVEDTIITGVKHTTMKFVTYINQVEDTIQNGVKHTQFAILSPKVVVEDTIENGVKETHRDAERHPKTVEDTIQNGVKYTSWHEPILLGTKVEDTIENGVKLTNSSLQIDGSCVIEDVIENGVKETCCHDMKLTKSVEKIIQNGVKNTYSDIVPREYDWSDEFDVEKVIENGVKETHDDVYHNKGRVDGVIRNGVKVVIPAFKMIYNPMNFEAVSVEEKRIPDVTDVIRNGIKEIQPLPAQDGNRDWGVYYYRKGEPTKPHTKYVDEVIENGIKEN
jgi:tartrate dehydratase alpha subunit/fumarate hydratase class I-like protein